MENKVGTEKCKSVEDTRIWQNKQENEVWEGFSDWDYKNRLTNWGKDEDLLLF